MEETNMSQRVNRCLPLHLWATLILLSFLYLLVPLAVRAHCGAGWNSLDVGFYGMRKAVGLGLYSLLFWWYWSSIPPHVVTGTNRTVVWVLLPLLAVGRIGGPNVYESLPSVHANDLLHGGELASLPESASKIRVTAWSAPMPISGSGHLTFEASREDIERFVSASPILLTAQIERYEGGNQTPFVRRDGDPLWYLDGIEGPATRYKFVPKARPIGPASITLTIDEARAVVFVYVNLD